MLLCLLPGRRGSPSDSDRKLAQIKASRGCQIKYCLFSNPDIDFRDCRCINYARLVWYVSTWKHRGQL